MEQDRGGEGAPSFLPFKNMTLVSFHLFHFFGGLVPPLKSPQPLDFSGFFYTYWNKWNNWNNVFIK